MVTTQSLNAANGRLKRDRIPVRIFDSKGRIYLEATLPPSPRSRKSGWHQQQLALKMPIRPDTISIAEKKARLLAQELADGSFCWDNWRSRPIIRALPIGKSTEEWIEEMKTDYFTRRADTPQARRTWKDYQGFLDRLPQGQPLLPEMLANLIRETKPETRTRQKACLAMGMLARFSGIDIDLSPYRGRCTKKMLTPRDLPSDRQIEQARKLIHDPSWLWLYGILAAYGVRPHEAMLCEFDVFPKLDVLGGKTGARLVYPCPVNWAESWQLGQVDRPKITGSDNSAIGNRISHAFKRFKIPFPPSVLRHCWAVRSSKIYLVDEAAKMMGHSPSIHMDTYHYWISDTHLRSAFDRSRKPPDDSR